MAAVSTTVQPTDKSESGACRKCSITKLLFQKKYSILLEVAAKPAAVEQHSKQIQLFCTRSSFQNEAVEPGVCSIGSTWHLNDVFKSYGSLGRKPEYRHLFSGGRMADDMKTMFFSNIQVMFSFWEINATS